MSIRSNLKVTEGRRALYWALQSLGWGTYFAYCDFFIVAYAKNPRLAFVQWPVVVITHFLASHVLRAVIKARGWIGIPWGRLLPRLLLTFCILDVAVQSICAAVACSLRITTIQQYVTGSPVYLAAALVLFSVWTALYLGFEYSFLYRDSELEKLRLEASLREAELQALKSQVNPHFLFNCLNNVRSLVAEDAESARDMLVKLSELLRYALEAGRHDRLPLREELRIAEAYLQLEKLQLAERLRWRVDVPDQLLDIALPPMLLQQLVENAIKHGISKLSEGGDIQIRAEEDGSRLVLRVENSGYLAVTHHAGVGLRNARERIRLLSGPGASIRLETAGEMRVVALAEIPL